MRFRTLVTLFVFLAGSTILLAVADPSKAPEPKPKDKEEEVLTFTTKDFERKYGKSPKPKPAADPAAEAGKDKSKAKDGKGKPADLDPLAQLQADRLVKQKKAAQRSDAQQRVQAAQDKVAELEKRLARLRNPLLGRPQPTDEEKEAWEGTDQVGRLHITEENLATARAELAQARTALSELR